MYDTTFYDVSYATASDIAGPYTKAQAPNAPLLVSVIAVTSDLFLDLVALISRPTLPRFCSMLLRMDTILVMAGQCMPLRFGCLMGQFSRYS